MKFSISIVFFISILLLVLPSDNTSLALDTETSESSAIITDEKATTATSEEAQTTKSSAETTGSPAETTEHSTDSTEPSTATTESPVESSTDSTERSAETTGSPAVSTESPAETTEHSTDSTKPSTATSESPVESSTDSTESSVPSTGSTQFPAESSTDGTESSAATTESPAEITTEPPVDKTTTISTTTTTTKKPSLSDNINSSTQNFLGINCMVNSIYNIEDVTSNFEFEMDLCGRRVKMGASSIFNEIENLKKYAEQVQNTNDKICKNKNLSLDKNDEKVPSSKCVKNLKRAVLKLNKSLNKTIQLVNAHQKETTSFCAKISLLKFRLLLNNFNAAIEECASIATS